MKTRCRNPNSDRFAEYGARGIDYCGEWENFETFLADMGERPGGTTLDRIDGALGYRRNNCRWATPVEQTRNRKRTRIYIFRGETKTAQEFATQYGLSYACAKNRLDRGQDLTTIVGRWV